MATYYDLLYQFKDFSREANRLAELVRNRAPYAKTVLDVGCGTHEHVVTLKEHFSVDGIDVDSGALELAKMKNPTGRYVKADMRDFELAKTYDAVICLHSSIGYLNDSEEIRTALRLFNEHTAAGGLVVVEPWFSPATFEAGKVSLVTSESDGLQIARASIRTRVGSSSRVSFSYLIARSSGFESFEEHHDLCLIDPGVFLEIFSSLDMDADYIPDWSRGRGLFVARRRVAGA